jgi:hypothetical protein
MVSYLNVRPASLVISLFMSPDVTFLLTVPFEHQVRIQRLLSAMCEDFYGTAFSCQTPEKLALDNIGHRGDAEKIERLLCEGMVNNANCAKNKLPVVTLKADHYTTKSMSEERDVKNLLDRPLHNDAFGNLGADIVVLKKDPAKKNSYIMHLIQVKRGTTLLGYPKKNCGPTNTNRSVYHIHDKLCKIGTKLTKMLRDQFQEQVQDITPSYHLITTADVRADSRTFLTNKNVNFVVGDTTFRKLMPERLHDHLNAAEKLKKAEKNADKV